MALSNAERQANFRAKQKEVRELSDYVIKQLNKALKAQIEWYEDKTNSKAVEERLFQESMSLMSLLSVFVKETKPESETAELLKKIEAIDLS